MKIIIFVVGCNVSLQRAKLHLHLSWDIPEQFSEMKSRVYIFTAENYLAPELYTM